MVVQATVINSLNTTPVFVSPSWERSGDVSDPTFKRYMYEQSCPSDLNPHD